MYQPQGWQAAHINSATVELAGAKYVWIHGLEIEGCLGQSDAPKPDGYGQNCISLIGGAGEGCRLINNQCSKAQYCGIKEMGHGGTDFLIEGNVIFGNHDHGVVVPSNGKTGIIVRGNAVFRNAGNGVHLYSEPSNHYIYANICFENDGSGIIEGGNANVLAHNFCAKNKGLGIFLFRGGWVRNVFINGLCLNNAPAQSGMDNGGGAPGYGTPTNNILDYCTLYPRSNWASPESWFSTWAGSHLGFSNPLVVDETVNDFRLQAGSPCRGVAGNIKLLGARPYPDIGLFPASYYWQPDIPANILTYTLAFGAPSGMTIDSATGVIKWTPPVGQGPGPSPVTVSVTDNGVPPLSDAKAFNVTVTPKPNTAPVLASIADQTLNELTTLSIDLSATDADLPANPLTFSVVSAPLGLTANPSTGRLTWTPTEAQGPSTNVITVRVTDNPDGSGPLSDTKTFMITVNEVNQAPVLAAIPDKNADAGSPVSFAAIATDADLPAKTRRTNSARLDFRLQQINQ